MNASVGNVVSKLVATESYRTSGKAKGLIPLAKAPHKPPTTLNSDSLHTPYRIRAAARKATTGP